MIQIGDSFTGEGLPEGVVAEVVDILPDRVMVRDSRDGRVVHLTSYGKMACPHDPAVEALAIKKIKFREFL